MASGGGKRWPILSFSGGASGKQSRGVTLPESQSEGLSAIGFHCLGLGGENTCADGPEAILFCVSEGQAAPGQVGRLVSIFWI